MQSDPCIQNPQMTEAMKKVVRRLFNRGRFKIILREEVRTDANCSQAISYSPLSQEGTLRSSKSYDKLLAATATN